MTDGAFPFVDEVAAALASVSAETAGTVGFLARLGRSGFRAATGDVTVLERLLRKVEVAKRVWAAYDDTWSKPLLLEPLPAYAWPALVTAFLLRAEAAPDRAGRFKWLNGACSALDLAETTGAGLVHRHLRQELESRLKQWLEPEI